MLRRISGFKCVIPSTMLGWQSRNMSSGWDARPTFELTEVNDDPANGYQVRVQQDEKRVIVTMYPQLGPRKRDPNDPAPQFDLAARKSVRLFQHEVAGLLCVCQGMLTQHKITAPSHDLIFEKTSTNGFLLSGTLNKMAAASPCAIRFESYHATLLKHFLEGALVEGFGFRSYFSSEKERQQQQQTGNQQQYQQSQNRSQQQQSTRQRSSSTYSSGQAQRGQRPSTPAATQ